MAEEHFTDIFKDIYEEEFIDHIFLERESLIGKEDFVISVAGDLQEDARCEWLF